MERKFLEDMGISKENADKILEENSKDVSKEKDKADQAAQDLKAAQDQLDQRDKDLKDLQKTAGDAEATKKALDDLQAKYDKDTAEFRSQIERRDYDAAVRAAVEKAGVKFTSKSAEKVFYDSISAADKKLKIKDGALEGFDDYLESARKEDPSAFVSSGGDQGKTTLTVDTQGSLGDGKAGNAPTSLAAALHERYSSQ